MKKAIDVYCDENMSSIGASDEEREVKQECKSESVAGLGAISDEEEQEYLAKHLNGERASIIKCLVNDKGDNTVGLEGFGVLLKAVSSSALDYLLSPAETDLMPA